MNRHQATSAVIGWIDIRSHEAAPERWLTPAVDDLATDLRGLVDRSAHAGPPHFGPLAPAMTTRFAPRAAVSCFAAAASSGAIGQIFANLAELSRELEVRIGEMRARLKVV